MQRIMFFLLFIHFFETVQVSTKCENLPRYSVFIHLVNAFSVLNRIEQRFHR